MTTDVVDSLDNERSLGFGADVVDQLRYGRQVTTREDVVVDKTILVSA